MELRKIVSVALLLFALQTTEGENTIKQYFPDYKLPEWWFEMMGIEDVYARCAAASELHSEPLQLRGSKMAFYPSSFMYQNGGFGTMVSASLKADLIKRSSELTESRLHYTFSRAGTYHAHALPVIYKHRPLPNLSEVLGKSRVTNLNEYRNFMTHPGGADKLGAEIVEDGYSRDKFRNGFYMSSPELVQYDWHEMPDPPKVFGQASSLERDDNARYLEQLFQPSKVKRHGKLEKVEVPKHLWKFSGTEHVQLSQAYLKNWVRGGQQSIALLSDLRFSAVYKDDRSQWDNNLIHKIGFIDSEGSRSRINDDLIEISSKYGINASKKWYYSLLYSFRTQFFDGYASSDSEKERPISAFMAPASMSLAAGMDFKVKDFTLLLAPITSRLTVVMDTAKIDQTRYSIDEDKKSLFLTGGSLQNNFTWNVLKDIKLTSAMNVFYDYFKKEDKVQAEWDLILDMKINVFLTTRISTNFRYYQSESSKLQARENLSIAFRYQF